MFFAAKHFDPQLGIDAHTYLAPPGVWPTVHIGIVMDPFDYLPTIEVSPDNPIVKGLGALGTATEAAKNAIGEGTASPQIPAPPGTPPAEGAMPESIPLPLGATVEVAGVRRANAGTGGVDFHILVGAPMPIIKGPGGPQFDDELFMGSRTVLADGDPFSRITMPVLSCNIVGLVPPFRPRKLAKPVRLSLMLPTTFNVAIPPQVFVGGPPTISWGAMIQRGLFKALGRAYTRIARRALKDMPPGFLKCQVLRAEPVDIRDGSVSVAHEDFHVPGRLPLTWSRVYTSRDHDFAGHCGLGWQTPADVRLVAEDDGILSLRGPEEFALFTELPRTEAQQVLDVVDGARLTRQGDALVVRLKSGLRYRFEEALSPEGALRAPSPFVTRMEDACGNRWDFVRQRGELARIVENGVNGLPGRSIEVQSRQGCIEAMALRDPATQQEHPLVRYRHADGDLLAAIDALGAAYEFAYLRHRMARHTDRTGLSFHYAYDDRWRVVHAWGDGGLHDYRFAYDEALGRTEVSNSLGHLTVVRFDESGLPLAEIDPHDGVTTFAYDDAGRTVAVTAPGGLRTGFVYDARGNLLAVQRPDGSSVGCDYDTEDRLCAIVDPLGHRWQLESDARGLPTRQTDPLGAVARFEHDAHGQLVRHVNARGAATQLHYDRHGQLEALVDPLGRVDRFTHDALGRLLGRTNALGETTRYHCDRKGRLVRIDHPDGAQILCGYDAEDRLVRHVDAARAETRLAYVGLGEIGRRIQPDGQVLQYHYDTEEQLVGVTNQRGERLVLRRDDLGRIVEEIDFWGQSRHYAYDEAGHLKQMTDPLGQRIAFACDKLGRITRKTAADPLRPGHPQDELLVYDRRGQLVEMRNGAAHVKRRFDAAGRVLEEWQNGFRVASQYDAVGNRTLRESSAGHRVRMEFDACDQLASLGIDDEAPIGIERDALGRIVREQLSASVVRHARYDANHQLTAQAVLRDASPLFSTRYDYDRKGQLVHRHDSLHGSDQYGYDLMGRVLQHIDPEGKVTRLLHDPAGDRLRTTIEQTRMQKVAGGDDDAPVHWTREGSCDGMHYVFDRAGDLVRRGPAAHGATDTSDELELTWDAHHRLIESRRGTVRTRYGYDAVGRRVFKRGATHTTWFFWDGDALLGEVRQAHDEQVAPASLNPAALAQRRAIRGRQQPLVAWERAREYVYYPQTCIPLALVDPPPDASSPGAKRVAHFHVEPNGMPSRLTDGAGEILWSATSTAWGSALASRAAAIDNPLRLQGQYFDEESGLHYNRNRYFDPHIGAFVSQDPIGLDGGENPYGFAPNALGWIDPLGLRCKTKRQRTRLRRILGLSNKPGNTQITARLTQAEARELAEEFVGPGFTQELTDKGGWMLRSEDGLRTVRGPSKKPTDAGRNVHPVSGQPFSMTGTQMNFQQRAVPKGPYDSNVHVDVEP